MSQGIYLVMKKVNGRYEVYGNPITKAQSRVDRWKTMLARKFKYDPNEIYNLSVREHPYGGEIFGLKEIVRDQPGEPIQKENGVIVSTIRMGFGHYRIAIAGVSAACAMGFTPYWLDLLSIPGVPTDVINWCNYNYSKFSRISQRYRWFDKYVWECLTTGEPTLPILNWIFNQWIVTWPWRFLKTEVKDYKMSELFDRLYAALPSDMPTLTSHMWNCMGAVAGGMTNGRGHDVRQLADGLPVDGGCQTCCPISLWLLRLPRDARFRRKWQGDETRSHRRPLLCRPSCGSRNCRKHRT
jgi:hypothetical protein